MEERKLVTTLDIYEDEAYLIVRFDEKNSASFGMSVPNSNVTAGMIHAMTAFLNEQANYEIRKAIAIAERSQVEKIAKPENTILIGK